MITRKYETIVGIFVVASLAALLVMVLIVAQQEGLFQEYVEYRAIFRDVSGLKPASEVHLAGVTVGNVINTIINPDGNIVVTFKVIKKYSDRIRQDSTATIGFMGLLGEKSLDLKAGSPNLPPIPPEGIVASVEPMDFTQILAKAAPSLDDLQKVITDLKEIVAKVNQGKGTLGLFVNDPSLYRETTQMIGAAKKLLTDFDQSIFGALKVKSPEFKKQVQKTAEKFQTTIANASEASGSLQQAASRLPDILKKLDSFLTNLDKAGKGLPGLVTQSEAAFSEVDTTTKGLQKSWLLRRYIPQPQEHTIRMDAEPGKD